jgi:uncharacterized SAM-binding protein YcdF (DUF218 family)
VKIVFVTLFLPLGLLLMAVLAMAVFLWREHRVGAGWYGRRGALVLGAVFLFGWVVSMPAFGSGLGALLFNQVKGRHLNTPAEADAVVVLTAGMINAGPAAGWLPKAQSIQRLAVAYELQRLINIRLPVIVSGGFTEGVQAPSEARVVADFFAHQRTEVTPTELEEVSTDTFESALQLAPVLAKRGARNVLLVTSDVHMLRALAYYRARGIDAIPAPAVALPTQMGVRSYLPSVYGLSVTSDAIYEIYGLVLALMSGRINFSDLTYNRE